MSGELPASARWIAFRAPDAGEDARPYTVLGTMPCHCCGARVLVKADKGLKVYAYCNGQGDDRQCGSSIKYARAPSQRIIAHWATVKDEPSPAPAPHPQQEPDYARVPEPVGGAAEPAARPEHPKPGADNAGVGGRRRFGVGRWRA